MMLNGKNKTVSMRGAWAWVLVVLAVPVAAPVAAMDRTVPTPNSAPGQTFGGQVPQAFGQSSVAPRVNPGVTNPGVTNPGAADRRGYPPVGFDPQANAHQAGTVNRYGAFDFPDVNVTVRGRMNVSSAASAAASVVDAATGFGNVFAQGFPYGQGYGAPYGTPFNSARLVPANADRANSVMGAQTPPPAIAPPASGVGGQPTQPTFAPLSQRFQQPPQWVLDNRKRQWMAQQRFAEMANTAPNGPQGYGPQGYGPQGYGPQGYGPYGYAPRAGAPRAGAPLPPMVPPYGSARGFLPSGPGWGGNGPNSAGNNRNFSGPMSWAPLW